MKIELFHKEGGRFLRPGEVGSAVQWHVTLHASERDYGTKKGTMAPGMSATVALADCSRWVSWDITEVEDLDKLDRAIEELTKARKALKKALAILAQKFPKEDQE